MLNYLWGGMFLAGIIYGAFAGTLPQITEGLLSGAKEAVELCLSVAGIVAFWTGLMTVAKETGFLRGIAAAMRPFLLWMMKNIMTLWMLARKGFLIFVFIWMQHRKLPQKRIIQLPY